MIKSKTFLRGFIESAKEPGLNTQIPNFLIWKWSQASMMDWPGVSTYFPRHLPPSFLQLETSTWTCFLGSRVIWSVNRSHLKYQICPAAYCQTESSPVFYALISLGAHTRWKLCLVFHIPERQSKNTGSAIKRRTDAWCIHIQPLSTSQCYCIHNPPLSMSQCNCIHIQPLSKSLRLSTCNWIHIQLCILVQQCQQEKNCVMSSFLEHKSVLQT